MKSPWKFLGSLISRGRSAEPDDGASSGKPEAEARPNQPQQSTALPSSSVEMELQSRTDDSAPPHKTEREAVERDPDGSDAAGAAINGEAAERPASKQRGRARANAGTMSQRNAAIKEAATRTKRTGRAKRTSPGIAAESGEAASNQEIQASRNQDGFHADVENVDAEVQRLRRQLAQALIVQNAQLQKLLERFGGT
jgi:hypothetical protein